MGRVAKRAGAGGNAAPRATATMSGPGSAERGSRESGSGSLLILCRRPRNRKRACPGKKRMDYCQDRGIDDTEQPLTPALLKGRGRSLRSFGCSVCCGLLSNSSSLCSFAAIHPGLQSAENGQRIRCGLIRVKLSLRRSPTGNTPPGQFAQELAPRELTHHLAFGRDITFRFSIAPSASPPRYCVRPG